MRFPLFRHSIILLLVILSLSTILKAQSKIAVNIFSKIKLQTVLITPVSGEYEILANDSLIKRLKKNELISVIYKGGELHLQVSGKLAGTFNKIEIKGKLANNILKIKPVLPSANARKYEDDLKFITGVNEILLINQIDLEKYIAGTVQTEGGPKSPLEYYKVQALLCRTYLYGHLNRHEEEGYQVCDEVHCQAYHGMCENNAQIRYAVEETRRMVIVDENGKIITAAYHSNCGGETVRSENVWSASLPYLIPIEEVYCEKAPHAHWDATISIDEWKDYLKKEGLNASDTLDTEHWHYDQHTREIYYVVGEDSLALKKIRADWKLKSTYFDIIPLDDELYFDGKGYGHGVGLCQEGAMEMARKGFDFKQILRHYYKNVQIIKY